MYTEKNYKSKKEFKEAFKNGETIRVYQPGGIFPGTQTGRTAIEGPHYPLPHKWYASVEVENYIIKRIVS